MLETQYVSLSAHNSTTVYVHPITFGHLLDWWYKQLEGMEHIKTKHGESQPYFYFPWLNPRWETEKGKKGLEPVLDDEQRSFFWNGLSSFGCFMVSNLP